MSKNNADFKQTLWKTADSLRAQMDAAEYKHIVLGLIFLKYISDSFTEQKEKIKEMVTNPESDFFISENLSDINEQDLEDRDYYTQDNVFWVPESARWETLRAQGKQSDIGAIIDRAMGDIESENKSLRGKLDKRFGRTQLSDGKLGQLIDLISTIGFTDDQKAGDMLGEIYEYFLGEFASAEGKKGGQFYTPRHVVKTLVAVLSPHKGRVYDPCCGSGGMFVQSEEFVRSHGGRRDDISIYGQESNPTTWRLAAMNMAIRGFAADLGKEPGDTFSNDQHPDKKFDFILINPPFNDSEWEGEKHTDDKRWTYGIPPNGNANYAWIQHVIYKLNSHGKAAIVLGSKSLDSSPNQVEYKIRKNIINEDLVEAIILLPEKLFVNTTTGICLWVLNKNKKNKNKTLFVNYEDRSESVTGSRKLRKLTDQSIDELENILKQWREGKNYKDELGVAKSVLLEEIQNQNWNLSPKRYVGIKKTNNKSSSDFNLLLNKTIENYRKLEHDLNKTGDMLKLKITNYQDIFSEIKDNQTYKDWKTIKIGEIFIPKNEKVGDRNMTEYSCTNFGIIPREKKFTKKLSKSISKNKVATKGDFVFGMSRQILNFGMMNEDEGCFSGAYKIYEIKGDILLSRYLESYVRNHHDYFYQCIPGGAREGKAISQDILFDLNAKIPPESLLNEYFDFIGPMSEQIKLLESLKSEISETLNKFKRKFVLGEIE